MFKRLAAMALVFGMAATAPPVLAGSETVDADVSLHRTQARCAPRPALIERLRDEYSEARRGAGVANATAILEIWTSDETGSWTILLTRPNGISCVIAVGTDWLNSAPEVKLPGNPV